MSIFIEVDSIRCGVLRNEKGLRFLLFMHARKLANYHFIGSGDSLSQIQWTW